MMHAAQGEQLVRKLVDARALALKRQDFQAICVVEVHVESRHDLVGVVVLNLVQSTRQVARVVVIDHGERPYDLLVGRAQALAHQRGAHEVANRFGSVAAFAAAGVALVKLVEQLPGDRNGKPNEVAGVLARAHELDQLDGADGVVVGLDGLLVALERRARLA